jgi:hypothetical protein
MGDGRLALLAVALAKPAGGTALALAIASPLAIRSRWRSGDIRRSMGVDRRNLAISVQFIFKNHQLFP